MGPEIWVCVFGSGYMGPGSEHLGPDIWVPIYGSRYLGLGIWVWVYGSELSNLIFMCLVSLDPDPE